MEMEELTFTTLQTNNYFQIFNKYWSQCGRTLAESPIPVVF